MATAVSALPVPAGAPTWSESDQFFKARRWLRFLVVLMVFAWLGLIGWIIVAPIQEAQAVQLGVGANLTIALAPVLAAAAAVERALESLFNVIEGSWRTMVAYLGRGLRWLKDAETEVKNARQFLNDVSVRYNDDLQGINLGQTPISSLTDEIKARIDEANKLMAVAQTRLSKAESNLADITSSDSYVSAKAAASIVLGLIFGVIIASVGQLQMFAMLGIGIVPARIDVFITGLVIGSGSNPVHSLIGILQQGKGAVDSARGYLDQLTALRQRVAAKSQEDNTGS